MTVAAGTGIAGLTLIFLCVVVALTAALVAIFYTLERSPRMMQLRQALSRRIDEQFGTNIRNGHR